MATWTTILGSSNQWPLETNILRISNPWLLELTILSSINQWPLETTIMSSSEATRNNHLEHQYRMATCTNHLEKQWPISIIIIFRRLSCNLERKQTCQLSWFFQDYPEFWVPKLKKKLSWNSELSWILGVFKLNPFYCSNIYNFKLLIQS